MWIHFRWINHFIFIYLCYRKKLFMFNFCLCFSLFFVFVSCACLVAIQKTIKILFRPLCVLYMYFFPQIVLRLQSPPASAKVPKSVSDRKRFFENAMEDHNKPAPKSGKSKPNSFFLSNNLYSVYVFNNQNWITSRVEPFNFVPNEIDSHLGHI